MRVRVEHQLHALVARQPGVMLVEIAAVDLAVDLEGDAGRGGGRDDPFEGRAVALALQDQSTGGMSDDVDPRAFDRAQHAVGHLRLVPGRTPSAPTR